MNIKKKIAIALAMTTICCAVLTACGDGEKTNGNSAVNATASVEEDSVDVLTVAEKLKNDITYKDSLNELSESMIEKLFGLAAGTDYKVGKVYVGSGGATAEEIACFEGNDSDSVNKIKEALEQRIDSQKKAFENYQPQEMEKLNSPVLVVKGNSVCMCISDDNSKAQEIIG